MKSNLDRKDISKSQITDLTSVYNDGAGRTATDTVALSGNIGGLTLVSGIYKSISSLVIS